MAIGGSRRSRRTKTHTSRKKAKKSRRRRSRTQKGGLINAEEANTALRAKQPVWDDVGNKVTIESLAPGARANVEQNGKVTTNVSYADLYMTKEDWDKAEEGEVEAQRIEKEKYEHAQQVVAKQEEINSALRAKEAAARKKIGLAADVTVVSDESDESDKSASGAEEASPSSTVPSGIPLRFTPGLGNLGYGLWPGLESRIHRRKSRRRGRSVKGSRSKTRPGDLDYTTKRGDKDYHRRGHDVRRKRRPYTKRRRRSSSRRSKRGRPRGSRNKRSRRRSSSKRRRSKRGRPRGSRNKRRN